MWAGRPYTPEQRRARRGRVNGYATQVERFHKQRRARHLRVQLARAQADCDDQRVHVTDGGKRLANARHNLLAAGQTMGLWRETWDCARYRAPMKGVPEMSSSAPWPPRK